ncbi:aromatic-L-amino-acid decarboxylase-like isoform X2 [Ptychodera flava]|uniref:aromatic-L-amino-acid decarboxylase-like isoform X2 n=1 Tax=Ptychodera flava TaxID=63121 RepID=UPI00396A06EE
MDNHTMERLGYDRLELGSERRRLLTQKVTDFIEEHLQKVEKKETACFNINDDRASGLLNFSISEEPKDIGAFYLGPGAARLEQLLISWVAGLFNFPAGFAGNLTSGGSTATVLSFLTARQSKQLKARDFERTVIYLTDALHVCAYKALNVIGLGEAILRKVPMDKKFRMVPEELRKIVKRDKEAGLLPAIVAASVGTTNFGSVDPIDEIADVAEEFNLWLHVDAAYGGFFVLVDEMKYHFKGVHRADSIIVDPHKSLFMPLGLGVVVVKDGYKLHNANILTVEASYLRDVDMFQDEKSPKNFSFELSKHFRGVRVWLPLQLYGIKPFRECLKEKVELARYFTSRLGEIPGFVVDNYPQLTVVTFHYETGNDDTNERVNQHLLERILQDGSVYISSTTIGGKFRLRICVLHFRSHKDTIDFLLSFLTKAAVSLSSGMIKKLHWRKCKV